MEDSHGRPGWLGTDGSSRSEEHSRRSPEGLTCRCHSHDGFLTRRGYELVTARGVDKAEAVPYLDRVGSVSALVEGREGPWVDEILEDQYRRFLNGS